MPISASAVPPNDTVQAQSPNSDPPLPSKEMQTEPPSIGGTRRISWSKANIRMRRLGTLMDQGVLRKVQPQSSNGAASPGGR